MNTQNESSSDPSGFARYEKERESWGILDRMLDPEDPYFITPYVSPTWDRVDVLATQGGVKGEFLDYYNTFCSVEQEEPGYIRLGVWKALRNPNQGYPRQPEDLVDVPAMELTQDHAIKILPYLECFAESGVMITAPDQTLKQDITVDESQMIKPDLSRVKEFRDVSGREHVLFDDNTGRQCHVSSSPLATEDAIWFGVDDEVRADMLLTQPMVKGLLPIFREFAATGQITVNSS